MTDPLGQSQVLPYLVGISEAGYDITLISFEKPDTFAKRESHIRNLIKESGIAWKPQIYTSKPPVISTLLDLRRMGGLAKKINSRKKIDIIHARSYISALIGLSFKQRIGVKFLFDMRGFWADERVAGGMWNIKNPLFKMIYSFFKKKEIEFFKNADYAISLTHSGKKEIESWKELKTSLPSIKVIPCCADNQLFNQSNISIEVKETQRKKLDLNENHFVLGYVGAIGSWYLLPEMLRFFKKLLQKKPDAVFLFITREAPEIILSEAEKAGVAIDNVRIISANREEMPSLLSLLDVSIFFLKPIFSEKARSPTKQGELMNMGVPVICNKGIGDTEAIIDKYKAGHVIESFTNDQYDQAIENIDKLLELDDSIMKQGASEVYSLEKGIDAYTQVYQTILAKN